MITLSLINGNAHCFNAYGECYYVFNISRVLLTLNVIHRLHDNPVRVPDNW